MADLPRIRIATDSVGDVPEADAARLGIAVIPVLIDMDGTTVRDGVDMTREQFYARLPACRALPKTAVPPAEDFLSAYRRLAEQGASDIVSIHLGRRYSSVVDAARAAADMAAAEPGCRGARIHVVDSNSLALSQGWMAIAAAEMAAQGAGVPDILRDIPAVRSRAHIYAMADTLRYLRKGGRVNALVAGIGEMLQLRLLVEVRDGQVLQLDRTRARSRGLQRVIEAARQHARIERLAVLHSGGDVMDDVARLQSSLSDRVPASQQMVMPVTPVIGAHFGPQGVGVALLADV
jgi:DegV family protein with EDD domain